mmetsp:Transcript_26410/g.57612  ORF Transcript_26410/g.57612 Transcript_26410/m.57612 type:complete len:120 (-) Transcript_26410:376-735(-)
MSLLSSCRPLQTAFKATKTEVRRPAHTLAVRGRSRSARLYCAAQQQEDTKPVEAQPAAPPPTPEPTPEKKPLVLEKGQGTAIVTGAVSVIFGVAYLVVVFLLDSRGGELQPPPPEAFIP